MKSVNKTINRQTTSPIIVPRTRRNHKLEVLTSLRAGKIVPLAVIPMLREDDCKAHLRVACEMLETNEILMNPTFMRVTAYVVPLLALERFNGSRDEFDKSYKGENGLGGAPIDFIETHAMGTHGSKAVYKALGLHAAVAQEVNTAYLEAYNLVVNYRAKNRSQDIAQRTRLQADLAPAHWLNSRFEHVVPSFDQAVIDGEVALNVINSQMPVKGIGMYTAYGASNTSIAVRETEGSGTVTYPFGQAASINNGSGATIIKMSGNPGYPEIYAEMEANGITVSLSNLEMARKTQAFAKLREKYAGIEDEYIIDMLMDGLTIPDQHLKQPIMLADKIVPFGQAKRYATDAGNLAESAVSGAAALDLHLRVPKLSTGGVVIVMAECLPDQLFERQADPFFLSADVADWPEFLRDTLDPQKVDAVLNGEVDTDHATPSLVFGYAPMNWKWSAWGPRIGGDFYRPSTDTATDTLRKRLWAVENEDPVLGEDFYLANDIHNKPFLDDDAAAENFQATVNGLAVIGGNTVFGGMLVESTGSYDEVAAKAPTDQIDQTP